MKPNFAILKTNVTPPPCKKKKKSEEQFYIKLHFEHSSCLENVLLPFVL